LSVGLALRFGDAIAPGGEGDKRLFPDSRCCFPDYFGENRSFRPTLSYIVLSRYLVRFRSLKARIKELFSQAV